MKRKRARVLSLVLTIIMGLTFVPALQPGAFAEEAQEINSVSAEAAPLNDGQLADAPIDLFADEPADGLPLPDAPLSLQAENEPTGLAEDLADAPIDLPADEPADGVPLPDAPLSLQAENDQAAPAEDLSDAPIDLFTDEPAYGVPLSDAPLSLLADDTDDAEAAPKSGTCGEKLTWTLTETDQESVYPGGAYELKISGQGMMEDYSYKPEGTGPWYDYRFNIVSIQIDEGVTSIGKSAFFNIYQVESIKVPDSVTRINQFAFTYCRGLQEITLPKNLHYVEKQAFYNCEALTDIYYSGTESQWNDIYFERNGNEVLGSAAIHCAESGGADEPEFPDGQIPSDSGCHSIEKMSKPQIANLLADASTVMPTDPAEIFDDLPSVKAPYSTGKVKNNLLQQTTDRLNALRAIAGLTPVELDEALCEKAQYGAVLLAASEFSHYPKQPGDMADDFYEQGEGATSSSNIFAGVKLPQTPDGFMKDYCSVSIIILLMLNILNMLTLFSKYAKI